MKVRFLKGIASIFGTFESGMVIDMPNEKIAASWLRNGIAEQVRGQGIPEKIAKAPAKNRGNKRAKLKK